MSPAKRKPKAEPKLVGHRQYGVNDDHAEWCREVIDFENRQDSVPVLNGVEVGQVWRNVHVGSLRRVVAIWLGGLGTHTAHYESIVLVDLDKEVADMFDISGSALWSICRDWEQVELVGDEWVAVSPQPFVWDDRGDARAQRANGTYRSERAWVGRVKHDRPQGEPVSWEGKRKTRCNLYANGVLTCDGICVGNVHGKLGFEATYKKLVEEYPYAKPKEIALRNAFAGKSG